MKVDKGAAATDAPPKQEHVSSGKPAASAAPKAGMLSCAAPVVLRKKRQIRRWRFLLCHTVLHDTIAVVVWAD